MGDTRNHRLARVAIGVAAVLAQLALAFYYVGLPLFVVPDDWIRVLWVVWVVQVIAVIWLAIRHTWFAPLVPIASLIAVRLIYDYGNANLGWGA